MSIAAIRQAFQDAIGTNATVNKATMQCVEDDRSRAHLTFTMTINGQPVTISGETNSKEREVDAARRLAADYLAEQSP